MLNHNQRFYMAVIMLSVFVVGCAATKKLTYEHVNSKDGVSNWEAKLIAQHELEQRLDAGNYHIESPKIFTTKEFPLKWFVRFYPKYMGQKLSDYLVVIDHPTGKINYSGPWWPNQKRLSDLINGVKEKW